MGLNVIYLYISKCMLYSFCRASADEILNTAQRVIDALKEAEAAQEKAHTANDQADQDIKDAEMDLTQVREAHTLAAAALSTHMLPL